MKLKFYSKLAVLLCTMVPHCFAATASAVLHENPAENARVAAGLAFIKSQDDKRCEKYKATPGEFAQYTEHTTNIDILLSDENKVSDEAASDAAIRTIVTAAIDKEITHRNDGSKPASLVKEKKDKLGNAHRLYNHFHVLSLIEDVAVSFVTGTTNVFNSTDFNTIASSADSIYAQILGLNAKITKQLFTECLSITYKKHKSGIRTVMAKEKLAEAEAETERKAQEAAAKLQAIEDAKVEAAKLQALEAAAKAKAEQEALEAAAKAKAEQEALEAAAKAKAEQEALEAAAKADSLSNETSDKSSNIKRKKKGGKGK
jgi:hypothetical protein